MSARQPPWPTGSGASPPGRRSFDPRALRITDYAVAGGTLLYLVMALLPWVDIAAYLGIELPGVDTTVSGFAFSGLVWLGFVLLLLAAGWTVLPALVDVPLGFPRGSITVGLAAMAFVLTLVAWTRSLGYGFEVWALIGLLTAAGITLLTVLALLRDLRAGASRPSGGAAAPEGPPTTSSTGPDTGGGGAQPPVDPA
jgi:hypothetical protein